MIWSRTEVLTIMAHLLLSFLVIGSYLTTVIMGSPDPTLQNATLLIVGYWFGAVGVKKTADVLKKRKDDHQ